MIRSVLSSIGSRLAVMFLTLGSVVMITQTLGDEGQGQAALIQLGILLIVSVTNFIGGGAVVYLAPRVASRALLMPAYLWSIGIAAIFYSFFHVFPWLPEGFEMHTAILGLLQALFTFHLQLMVGKEKVHRFNLIVAIQALVLAGSIFVWFFLLDQPSIEEYVRSLYASFIVTWLLSFAGTLSFMKRSAKSSFSQAFKEMWNFGKFAQLGNILQLLNYRLNFLILERMISVGATGLYSLSFYASEAIWNVGKSLSLVQGSRIVNSTDDHYNQKLTLVFLHISIVGTVGLIAIMLLIPDTTYQWIFGEEMAGLHTLLIYISPGILANACSVILAHYFSGVGKHSRNTIGSAAGLIALLITVFPLISEFAIEGAAIAASIGYIVQCLTMFFLFMKMEQLKVKDLFHFSETWKSFKQRSIKGA